MSPLKIPGVSSPKNHQRSMLGGKLLKHRQNQFLYVQWIGLHKFQGIGKNILDYLRSLLFSLSTESSLESVGGILCNFHHGPMVLNILSNFCTP